MAKSLKDFADAMEGKAGEAFEAAAIDYIRDVLTAHQMCIRDSCETDRRPASSEAGFQFLKRSEGFVSSRYSFDCPPLRVVPKWQAMTMFVLENLVFSEWWNS